MNRYASTACGPHTCARLGRAVGQVGGRLLSNGQHWHLQRLKTFSSLLSACGCGCGCCKSEAVLAFCGIHGSAGIGSSMWKVKVVTVPGNIYGYGASPGPPSHHRANINCARMPIFPHTFRVFEHLAQRQV